MTKADIIEVVSEKVGLGKHEVKLAIETFIEEIKSCLNSGENFYYRGFGSFIIKKRAEKIARNISKGTAITIPSYNAPVFKPAKELKESVKNNVSLEK